MLVSTLVSRSPDLSIITLLPYLGIIIIDGGEEFKLVSS